jgi:hypothetical protein
MNLKYDNHHNILLCFLRAPIRMEIVQYLDVITTLSDTHFLGGFSKVSSGTAVTPLGQETVNGCNVGSCAPCQTPDGADNKLAGSHDRVRGLTEEGKCARITIL